MSIPFAAVVARCLLPLVQIFATAFGLSKLLRVSVAGVGVIMIMVIIAFAASFITSLAKRIGKEL